VFKKNIMFIGMIMLAGILTLINCSKKSTPTGSGDQGDDTPDPSIYYPHIAGSWWIFSYPGGAQAYKLELGPVYDHPQAGETQKLEIYQYNGSDWSLDHVYYQKVTNTDVRIYQYTGSFYELMLVMPLDVGDHWGYNLGQGDNVHCTAEESLTTPAGSFDTKKVEYNAEIPMTAWFASGIGSFIGVKNTGWFQDSLGNPQTVVLSSYHLEAFSQG
jgi:hypothetical protein